MMSTTTASSSITESIVTNSQNSNNCKNQIRIHRLSSMTDERDAISGSSSGEILMNEIETSSIHSVPNIHGVIAVPSRMEASAYEDDPLVYANLSAIETKKIFDDIDRRPLPPFPDDDAVPLKVLPSGWQEFVSPGGRSYYFHPETKTCQWKPPRGKQCNMMNQQKIEAYSDVESIKDVKLDEIKTHQPTIFPVEMSSSLILPEDKKETTSTTQKSLASMSNSVDSGYGKSLVCKNPTFGMNRPSGEMFESAIVFDSNQLEPIPTSSKDDSFLFNRNFSTTAIKKGNLEKMKISDCGHKTKRREWISAYAYLVSGHLLFYKDQKRAEKFGKHYNAPTDVCDLRGAKLSLVDPSTSKDKRRRQIIDLIMTNNTEYWFGIAGNDSEVENWYNMLSKIINTLPSTKAYPLPSSSDIPNCRPLEMCQSPSLSLVKTGLRNSQKSKSKYMNKETIDNESSPTRESIIERLLRFFRQRPSVEQLRERGIYRPEPIFGSTLQAICQHDRTNVPIFITEITKVIEDKGLTIDGIYRVSGNLSSIQKIRCQVDQDRYEILWKEDDIHVLTGALKLFFRELSEPIFPVLFNKEFMAVVRQTNIKIKIKTMDDLLKKLPQIHRETLKVLFDHLLRVSSHSDKNRMNIHSLAIMFGPALFSTEDKPLKNTNTVDKKTIKKNKKSSSESETTTEPNQILAYKMIVFGQIVEFLLKEYSKLTVFQSM